MNHLPTNKGRWVKPSKAARIARGTQALQKWHKANRENKEKMLLNSSNQQIKRMASKLVEEAEAQVLMLLKKAFDDTDTDNSGTICATELKGLFEKAGLQDTSDTDIQEMITKCDKNNDSVLSFDEIVEGVKTIEYLNNVLSLRGQFLMVDADKSGFITLDEHMAAINGMGNPWNFTEDDMREVFQSMDVNGDGKVSFDELIKIYCSKK